MEPDRAMDADRATDEPHLRSARPPRFVLVIAVPLQRPWLAAY
jgi:hypothetical protein